MYLLLPYGAKISLTSLVDSRRRFTQSLSGSREKEPQAQTPCTEPQFLLHGREMPRHVLSFFLTKGVC